MGQREEDKYRGEVGRTEVRGDVQRGADRDGEEGKMSERKRRGEKDREDRRRTERIGGQIRRVKKKGNKRTKKKGEEQRGKEDR